MEEPDFGGIANRLLCGPAGKPQSRAQKKEWKQEVRKHSDAIPPRPPKPMKNRYRFDAQRGCTVKDDGAPTA